MRLPLFYSKTALRKMENKRQRVNLLFARVLKNVTWRLHMKTNN